MVPYPCHTHSKGSSFDRQAVQYKIIDWDLDFDVVEHWIFILHRDLVWYVATDRRTDVVKLVSAPVLKQSELKMHLKYFYNK